MNVYFTPGSPATTASYHHCNPTISEFLNDQTTNKYHSIKYVGPEAKLKEHAARNLGIEFCVEMKCDFYLSLDGEAHLDYPETVKLLIGQNRNVIAPMLVRPHKAWSNFWGALNNEGRCPLAKFE